ncbi:galaxin-2 isoform X2 [Octopus bimaculoides]|nr:galaxin-2 isoform X2 [Octopus bimaculoides]
MFSRSYQSESGIEKRTGKIMFKILIAIASALLAIIGSTTALHPHYIPQTTYYCNGQAYNVYNSICCGTQISSITGFKAPACCGNIAFDRDANLCCGGALVARKATANGCCGLASLDLSINDCCAGKTIARLAQICCNGAPIDRTSIYDVCCGAAKMDKTKAVCCNGNAVTIAPTFPTGNNLVPNTYACCGTSVFRVRSNYCFYNQVLPRTNYVSWWQSGYHHHHYDHHH